MAIETYEIRNRWTGEVQVTATIDCEPNARPSVKLGLAIRWAVEAKADMSGADMRGADMSDAVLRGAVLRDADMRGADMRGADMRGADMRGADMRGAVLSDAVLRGAVLSDADMRFVKADVFLILALAHREVPALVAALREGRIDGSTYAGPCSCLVGTLTNYGAKDLPEQPSSPAEQWFASIHEGDKPGDDSEGGCRAAKALEWALEYCAATGIELEAEIV